MKTATITLVFNWDGWSGHDYQYSDSEVESLYRIVLDYAAEQNYNFTSVRDIQKPAMFLSTDPFQSDRNYSQDNDLQTEGEQMFERILERLQ